MRSAAAGALVVVAYMTQSAPLAAENHVTLRGQYYREHSTRVVQPVMELGVELPRGVDVTTHYLLDAITSASAAAGPVGDNIFTEYRNESGVAVGKSWSRMRVGGAYKYSAESDYWSHTFVGSVAARLWADTATLALSVGQGFDQVGRRGDSPPPPGRCSPSASRTCSLDTTFGGIGYSQVLSPTVLIQVGYEAALMRGYLASPYRTVNLPAPVPEQVPDSRFRNSVSARVAKYFPRTSTGIQLQYRYYWDFYPGSMAYPQGDPWNVRSHTPELRVFQGLGKSVEVRLTGRYYSQGPANFACDTRGAPAGCYAGQQISPNVYTSQPQLGPVATGFTEAKVYWDAAGWRAWPFFGWFAAGTFELSYGLFFQDTSFGRAHLLQTGYTIPF